MSLNDTQEKACTVCGQTKDLSLFGNWGKQRPGKLKAQCKDCLSSKKREWHAKNLDAAHASNAKWVEEHKDERAEYLRAYSREYRMENQAELSEKLKEWYAKNSETVKKKVKQWASHNHVRVVEAHRQGYQANKDRIKAHVKEWASKNPEKCRAYGAQRRARQAAPMWASKERILDVYAECKRLTQVTGVPHVVDHIYPLQGRLVSGLHVPENLAPIPALENARKGNKLPGHIDHELWEPQGRGVYHA